MDFPFSSTFSCQKEKKQKLKELWKFIYSFVHLLSLSLWNMYFFYKKNNLFLGFWIWTFIYVKGSSIIKQSITKSFPHLSLSHWTIFSVLPKKSCVLLPLLIYYSLFEEWAFFVNHTLPPSLFSALFIQSLVNFKA